MRPQVTTDRRSGVVPEKCHSCIWTQASSVSEAQVRLWGSLGWPRLFPSLPWGGISLTLGGQGRPVLPSQVGMRWTHSTHHHHGRQIVMFSLIPDREWGTERCCNVSKITQLHSRRVGIRY